MKRLTLLVRAASGALARLEVLASQVLIVLFTALLVVNVAARYLFSRPFYFAEELAVYILIWMAFLAIAVTIARYDMIRLTFLVNALPPRLARTVNIVIEVLVLAMLAALVYASWTWITSPAVTYERAITLGITKLPFLAIMPVFSMLALVHVVSNLLSLIFLPERETGAS